MAEERIQKLLAQAGLGSRRACEEFLIGHRVTVNGKLVELGAKADPNKDVIKVDGKRIEIEQARIYVMLNKPAGIVTTNEDEFDRKTVRDLVPINAHLFPVGRLDADSEGLVLLTNDGELTNALTHPRFEHEKEYLVLVEGRPGEGVLKSWRRGVLLEEQMTAPARVDVLEGDRDKTWLRVVMHEGRKRQIREVAGMLGHKVKYLERVRIGPLKLGQLKTGTYRHLTPTEVRELLASAGLDAKKPAKKKSAPRKPPVNRPGAKKPAARTTEPKKSAPSKGGLRSGPQKPTSRKPATRPSKRTSKPDR
ncbi:MAG: rRNA pseudouridine synthase [Chloroflexi bacterium]|nr:rRNA pseudouridine synthase [Chloroflexota bacterium]